MHYYHNCQDDRYRTVRLHRWGPELEDLLCNMIGPHLRIYFHGIDENLRNSETKHENDKLRIEIIDDGTLDSSLMYVW